VLSLSLDLLSDCLPPHEQLLFLPEPIYLLLHSNQLMLFSFGFIFICLILVMYFYLIKVDFALIDMRWWRWQRDVDGMIVSVGLR
jgi:hypothetical protein